MDAAIKLLSTLEPRRREADLARIIFSDDPRRSRAASQLVAATATADSIPLLLQMDRSPATRAAAVPALARLCPPELLATLARSHADPEPRRTLIAGLLATPEGTAQYLNLVLDASTSSDAFAALDRVPSPPTQGFFAALYDPHIGTRLAAARVLGRIDGPETTARLVAMAEQNQSRREALIALADSRGPEAKQFLQEAKRGGPLAGAVRSILIDSSLND
jgi:HEAT repeat protein